MLFAVCVPAGFLSTGLRPLTRRTAPSSMSLEADEMDTLMPAPAGFYKVPTVTEAAEDVAKLLDEDREAKVAQLFAGSSADAYLDERTKLIGEIGSAALLERDEKAGLWPPELSTDRDAPAMLWVDEYSCVGCRWCASVARNTFKVTDEYGTAMVMEQGGDQQDVIEEAIDVCPADCIHACSRADLEVLEEYRELYQNDMMAKFYHGSRLIGEGSGGGAGAAPQWRDPLVHTSWRQGSKFVKTERLKAGLDDLLIHEPGSKTDFSVWAKEPREVEQHEAEVPVAVTAADKSATAGYDMSGDPIVSATIEYDMFGDPIE
jgi:ferredoxin